MRRMAEIHPDEYLGRRTLILGEVNTGKTTLTRRILAALLARGDFEGRVAIVDMAPEIPEALAEEKGIAGVGGKLMPPQGHDVLYLGGHLAPPRLSSKTEAEAIEKARQNRRIVDTLFRKLDGEPREILLLNDVTIYLQAGTAEDLIRRLEPAATVIANGYWGERLGGGTLTEREKVETAKLKAHFESRGRVLLLGRLASQRS
ncbi:MAG: ATP-binding protein [Deltaproteobacteria bacterium]|nr:ATP-binding protein [Deltaproteobacteria bacterium]